MKFEDTATDEQLRIRKATWGSIQGLMGKPKTAQLIDLILKTCRKALNGEYFVAYHDIAPDTDLLLLLGKRQDSGFYTIDSILINDMFKTDKGQDTHGRK